MGQSQESPSSPAIRVTRVPYGVIPFLLNGLVGLLTTLPAWWEMFKIGATNPDASHLLLAPPATILAIWHRRRVFNELRGRNDYSPILLTLGMALGLWGWIDDRRFPWHVAAVVITIGAFLWPLSRRAARALLHPIAILLFCVPLPGAVDSLFTTPLTKTQLHLIDSVAWLTQRDWIVDGQVIVVHGHDVALEKGCAGFRLLWPATLAALTASCISSQSFRRRIMIVCSAPVCALILNFLRVLATLYLYDLNRPVLAEQVHDGLGFILLGLAVLIPLVLLTRGKRRSIVPLPDSGASPVTLVVPAHSSQMVRRPHRFRWWWPAIPILFVFWQPGLVRPDPAMGRRLAETLGDFVPSHFSDWIGAEIPLPAAQADRLQADQTVYRGYKNWTTAETAQVLISFHADGRTHRGHSAPRCYPSLGWTCLATDIRPVQVSTGSRSGNDYSFERRATPGTGLIVTEYVVDGGRLPDPDRPLWRRLLTAPRTGLARIQILFPDTVDRGRREQFVDQIMSSIEPWLEAVANYPDLLEK